MFVTLDFIFLNNIFHSEKGIVIKEQKMLKLKYNKKYLFFNL